MDLMILFTSYGCFGNIGDENQIVVTFYNSLQFQILYLKLLFRDCLLQGNHKHTNCHLLQRLKTIYIDPKQPMFHPPPFR